MQIQIAVYTAYDGYDWQTDAGHSREELNKLLSRVDKPRNVDLDEIPFGGAFSYGATVVAYRIHKALQYDIHSRNTLYVALAFVPVKVASRIDFERLLCSDEMAKPVYPPPSSVDIPETEGLPQPDWLDVAKTREYQRYGLGSLREAGPAFARAAEDSGELSLHIGGNSSAEELRYEYQPLVRVISEPIAKIVNPQTVPEIAPTTGRINSSARSHTPYVTSVKSASREESYEKFDGYARMSNDGTRMTSIETMIVALLAIIGVLIFIICCLIPHDESMPPSSENSIRKNNQIEVKGVEYQGPCPLTEAVNSTNTASKVEIDIEQHSNEPLPPGDFIENQNQ